MGNGKGADSYPLLTLIYPYYNNHDMLVHQQHEHWMRYPLFARECIEVIVVDDASPKRPAQKAVVAGDIPYRFRLYRIDKDVRWNWIAARNIGAHEAAPSWLFMTDMDHAMTAENVQAVLYLIMAGKLDKDIYYTFSRRDAPDLTPYKDHPNTYLMHRDLYWKNGGYDEEFSGFYGTDGYYRKMLNRVARWHRLDDLFVVRYPRDVIADASTTEYERKTEYDKQKKGRMAEKLKRGESQRALTFDYERIL